MALYSSELPSGGGGSFVPEGKMLTQSSYDGMNMYQEDEIGIASYQTYGGRSDANDYPMVWHWLNPKTTVRYIKAIFSSNYSYQKLKINFAILKNGVVEVKPGSQFLTNQWQTFDLASIIGNTSDADAILIYITQRSAQGLFQYSLQRE